MSKADIMAIAADIYYWAMNGPVIKVFKIKITNEISGVACNIVDSLHSEGYCSALCISSVLMNGTVSGMLPEWGTLHLWRIT